MDNLDIIKEKIGKLRDHLHKVLNEEEKIGTKRVLEISKDLDEILNKYYELISREETK